MKKKEEDLLFDLADANIAFADRLQEIARQLHFKEPENSQLDRNEKALRANASLLQSAAVSEALSSSKEAKEKIAAATARTEAAAEKIKQVKDAIKFTGLLLSLVSSVIVGKVPPVLSAADELLNAALSAKARAK